VLVQQEGDANMDGDCTGDALVVHCGYESSTVVPVIDSKPIFAQSTRLSVGGATLTNHLTHSLIHIQQSQHQQHFNTHRVQQLVEQYCEMVPEKYDETLREMALLYDVNQHTIPEQVPARSSLVEPVILQLPFVAAAPDTASSAETAARVERKEIQRQRFRTLMAERKEKKLAEDQSILADWEKVRADFHAKLITPSEFMRQLKRRTFQDEQDFAQHFDKLKKSIEQRLSGETPEEAAAAAEAQAALKASKPDSELYPLLTVPDAELTPSVYRAQHRKRKPAEHERGSICSFVPVVVLLAFVQ
jgi:actin-related protein 5